VLISIPGLHHHHREGGRPAYVRAIFRLHRITILLDPPLLGHMLIFCFSTVSHNMWSDTELTATDATNAKSPVSATRLQWKTSRTRIRPKVVVVVAVLLKSGETLRRGLPQVR